MRGVEKVVSGSMGGHVEGPTYKDVCSGSTGHAEVVQVTFDPQALSFADLLSVFFTIHDPTTLNRQGNDIGTQYRSVIFFHSTEQAQMAKQVIAEMANVWDAPIVTELSAVPTYYKAEAYHQDYFRNNPMQGYCAFVVAPKVAKFRSTFAAKLRS